MLDKTFMSIVQPTFLENKIYLLAKQKDQMLVTMKLLAPLKDLTLFFVLFSAKDLFTKFMKAFVESTQARN